MQEVTITIRAASDAQYQVWAGYGLTACRLGVARAFRSPADALRAARRLARRTGWRVEMPAMGARRAA